MKIVIFRYSAETIGLKYLQSSNTAYITTINQKKKNNDYFNKNEEMPFMIYLDNLTLPEVIKTIQKIKFKEEIESIITLGEDDIDWVGMLEDYFVRGKSEYLINTMFKDKYVMRSFLNGIVAQPDFMLIQSPNDIDLFRNKHKNKSVVIKPRNGSGSEEVKILPPNEVLEKNIVKSVSTGYFLIEECVDMKKMLTCDGYGVGKAINRFFCHEYESLIYDSLVKKSEIIIRTSRLYDKNLLLLKKIKKACNLIIENFGIENELIPFHFEWFYCEESNEIVFCEVGKRFGGGDIPKLINDAFEVNVLKEYWDIFLGKTISYNLSDNLTMPLKIACSIMPYKMEGIVVETPELCEFDWTKRTRFYVKKGDQIKESESANEILLLSDFISENEVDYDYQINKIKKLIKKFIIKKSWSTR